jgi:hypothetical protein
VAYVDTHGDEFKESIEWILTGEADPEDRKQYDFEGEQIIPEWKEAERLALMQPAKLYQRWHQIRDNHQPTATFNTIEEVLDYNKFTGQSFLVMPGVRIKGLPILESGSLETSLSIQNWFGDNSKLLVGREPRNPYNDM